MLLQVLVSVLYILASQTMAQGPAISASPRSLLEIHKLQPHPRPSQSPPAFYQDPQGLWACIKVWETPPAFSTSITWFSIGGTLTALTLFKGCLTTFKEKINYSEILYQKEKNSTIWVLNFQLTIKILNMYILYVLNFSKMAWKRIWLILSLVFILKTANSLTHKNEDKNNNDFDLLVFSNSFSTKKSVFFPANFSYGHFSDLIHSYF